MDKGIRYENGMMVMSLTMGSSCTGDDWRSSLKQVAASCGDWLHMIHTDNALLDTLLYPVRAGEGMKIMRAFWAVS